MSELKPISLQSAHPTGGRKKFSWKRFFRRHKLLVIILALVVGGIFWWSQFSSPTLDYVFSNSLPQSEEGRVNILLLGIGGGRHDGANLTDTIMVAGYDPKTHRVDLISLPRDLWNMKYKAKINTLYQTGLDQHNEFGIVQEEISAILGTEIPYSLRVDFGGFVKAIDLLEGIDVDVQKAFDDYEYPIEGKEEDLCGYREEQIEITAEKGKELNVPEGKRKVLIAPDGKIATDSSTLQYPCRFEHIHFVKGLTHMDGMTALKFVRSRHGTGDEGSDFARSKRQQLVIQSARSKALSLGTLTDPKKLVDLASAFGNSISSNIPQAKYLPFMNAIKQTETITSHVIDLSNEENLLIHPDPLDYGGGWVVIPPKNDYSRIHQYVNDIFSGKSATPSASLSPSPTATKK